ncbi:MAG: hypothetical protein LBD98_00135 [Endomicrobium sp.]|nr:hypothetical protein [Endomicrobium sp.]
MSNDAYGGCNYKKTIIGLPEVSILNGNGFAGISNSINTELHLSSITIYNFNKVPPYGSVDNGAGLYFSGSYASLHFDGNVNIISNTISGGGSSFQTYGGDAAGVCISNSNLIASSVTINFIANKSSDASGAALYFNGSKVNFFNDKILFQDNEAGDEGAALWAWDNANLYFTNSSVTFLRNKADMIATHSATTNPNPLGIGGAISIKRPSANIYFEGTSEVEFISNTARNGGAIYGAGTINFDCSSVLFSGNVASSSGGAIYMDGDPHDTKLIGVINLNSTNGDIIFKDNSAKGGDAAGHDIYFGRGRVNINGAAGKVAIYSGIAGTSEGTVEKSSSGLFVLGGKNEFFFGLFLQLGGTTTVIGEFFTGYSSIAANSVLEFSTGTVLGAGTIGLWDTGVMDITTPDDLTFSGQITGTDGTNINKPSSGTVRLLGNNRGFKGTFLQSSRTTKVETESGIATYFAGLSSITNESVLEIGDNGEFANEGEKIELLTNGELRITKSNGDLNLNGQV